MCYGSTRAPIFHPMDGILLVDFKMGSCKRCRAPSSCLVLIVLKILTVLPYKMKNRIWVWWAIHASILKKSRYFCIYANVGYVQNHFLLNFTNDCTFTLETTQKFLYFTTKSLNKCNIQSTPIQNTGIFCEEFGGGGDKSRGVFKLLHWLSMWSI